jgi:hypothetical protein
MPGPIATAMRQRLLLKLFGGAAPYLTLQRRLESDSRALLD